MRKISSKERKNGMRYCTFCKPVRERATYRNQYLNIDVPVSLACEEHKAMLVDGTFKPMPPDPEMDRRMNEEDHSEAWFSISNTYNV
ncbi:hypothetical protein U2H31_003692 [Pseudomonas aeruginosa]|jgi:hypothetical protein|nr:hypothetical protein [Pseudomonas aeruginosa]